MPEKYKNLYGYMNFEQLYDYIAKKYPNGRFLELGLWLGRSACFMCETIKENNLNIKFYGVDNFFGEVSATDQKEIVDKEGGSVYFRFLKNMQEAGVSDYITALQLSSQQASEVFDDESFDFIFLDAEHKKQDVLNDLEYWFKKVKVGGILAGHDAYQNNEVMQAVFEFFKDKPYQVKFWNTCFIVEK